MNSGIQESNDKSGDIFLDSGIKESKDKSGDIFLD